MKILYTVLLCICAMSVYAQVEHQKPTNATYVFKKAIFTTYNYNSKAEVEVNTIDDATVPDAKYLFYARNLFLEAAINNGELNVCKLFDGSIYSVKFATELTLIEGVKKGELPLQVYETLTPYTLSIDENGNTLTFTTDIPFGDSRYTFPLEGKLILTMTKQ